MFRVAQHDKITPMEIVPLGDSALIVRVRERFEDAPEETLDEVLRTFQRIRNAAIPGVIELAPAYTSVSVFFDPITVAKATKTPDKLFGWFATRIRAAVAGGADPGRTARSSRTIEVPVCYDSEFAPDLDHVAEHAKISTIEVVDLHSTGEYRAACIGFVPGFPFLSGLARKLATPRRDVPRREIPPGSVGIGGAQTGIYPLRSPGGWNLIGRTPLKLFDPTKDPPALLRAGDRVRFRAITREEFEALKQSKGHPDPAAARERPHIRSSRSADESV
jgi:inhibitor of KinA